MKIINEEFKVKNPTNHLFDCYFGGLTWATFDIETTGLSPKNSSLILVGIGAKKDDETGIAYQFFSEGDDEAQLIEETLAFLSDVDVVITYNGASFDIPFFKERAEKLGFKDVKLPYNLDLYNVIRRFSDIGNFTPNLKQTTIESFLGIWGNRRDEIDGKESIILYSEYMMSKSNELEEKILLHNSDDIKQLYRLLNVIEKTNFHRAMSNMGFPYESLLINEIKIVKGKLSVHGSQGLINYNDYGDRTGLYIDFQIPNFNLKLKIIEHLSLYFIDLTEHELNHEILSKANAIKGDYFVLGRLDDLDYKAINTLAKALVDKVLPSK